MQVPENILILIEKYLAGTITSEEKFILNEWYYSFNDSEVQLTVNINSTEQQLADRIKDRLLETVQRKPLFVFRQHLIWKIPAAAAAVLILTFIGTYFLFPSKYPNKAIAKTDSPQKKIKNDIAPGGNKAVLTLADGSVIVLDSATNGTIGKQGNTKIQKLDNGLLAYGINGRQLTENDEAFFNIISTPRGGQYKVVLADGTKVWLNAESSIRFPVAFTGTERIVEITGEAYFEVVSLTSEVDNTKTPFIVKIKSLSGDQGQIKVLGTHFNVNAYDDEAMAKTTLFEGKIKVTKDNVNTMLLPGQQTQMDKKGKMIVFDNADREEVMAWKDGLFVMKKEDIGSIMRKIARRYDVEIVYEGKVPPGRISGDIPRNMNLSKILEVMELSGVHFTIDRKKVIVKS